MANKYPLSKGALVIMMKGGVVENPIMQVLGSKKIASGSAEKERYRILLSDGKYLISFAMLTTQINDRIDNGELAMYSVIKINRYITSVINNTGKSSNKRILVILDMEMLVNGGEVGEKIGDPVQLPDNESAEEEAPKKVSATTNNDSAPPPAKKPMLSSSNTNNSSMNVSLQEQLTHPISSLSPYQNKWVIKARVTNKSPIRTWSNSKGEGKLFSFDLLDESGEIRVTGFREAVDKYYEFIQVDKVYYISKCQLKIANKQFSTLKNDYEMTLSNESIIQECTEDADNVPTTQYNFVTIDKLINMEVGSVVDVIAICKQAGDLQTFTAKSTGRELKKRELNLVDMSKTSVALTLWGQEAENFDYNNPVVAIKGARIGEFGGGKNLSAGNGSTIKYNIDIPEAFTIRGWFDNGGANEDAANISARSGGGNFQTNWLSFKEVKDMGLGNADKGDYYQAKGTVLMFRSENAFYKACPQENCNKKVIDMENGQYRCEKCNAEYPSFKYRLLGNLNVGDWSGNQWISMFTTETEKVLGKSSQEIGEAVEQNGEAMMQIANEANFKQFIFKCRAKMESYNDEARLKTVAIRVDPINYKEYNSHLISQIQQLTS